MFLTKEPIVVSEFLGRDVPSSCGGVASFLGIVRDHHHGKGVKELFYDCYEPMAEKQIDRICQEACEMFGVKQVRVLHRIGRLQVGDVAVAIEAHSAHRDEAFKACRFVIDTIKQRVPIWKHEFYEDSTSKWVLCSHNKEKEVQHA
jgi:molybdopterin synthase catalytic subunit